MKTQFISILYASCFLYPKKCLRIPTQAPAPRLNCRLMPRGAGGGMGIPEKLGPKGLCQEALRRGVGQGGWGEGAS